MHPRLYTDLAPWYPLLTQPAEYVEEAEDARATFHAALGHLPTHVLELGSGAGHFASQLGIPCTLVDLAPEMLALSAPLNPTMAHHVGDMRTVRLGRTFPAVLIHDAVNYMTTHADLVAALRTARAHLEPGGICYVLPDSVRETHEAATEADGHDGDDGRALRYLMWTHAPAPGESTYVVDFVLVCTRGESVDVVHDRHVEGLFSIAEWRAAFTEAGFASVTEVKDRFRDVTFLGRA
ncbi:MAG: class I SAM-dependent methyltransferase [Myxococcota bacterium]